jgi:polyhydroxybutyrate depolymerase
MGIVARPSLLARALVLVAAVALLAAGGARADVSPPTGLLPTLLSGLTGAPAPPPAPAVPPAPAPAGDPCGAAPVAGNSSISLASASLPRTAQLHLPPRIRAGRAVPLVVAFHGAGSNGPQFAIDSGLSEEGDQFGFAVLYPSALGHQWAITAAKQRDVRFVSDLLDRVEAIACIDRRRVYATGVSIGAGMAARVGCELSERTAGLVLVSGGYRALPACHPDRPVSILEIHGTADSTVPYSGQGPGNLGAVLPYMAGWAARDQCAPRPTKRTVAVHTVLYRWSGCASGALVEHLRIYGSGHGLPNAAGLEISSGHRTTISGVKNIWHFLASRTLAPRFPESPDG